MGYKAYESASTAIAAAWHSTWHETTLISSAAAWWTTRNTHCRSERGVLDFVQTSSAARVNSIPAHHMAGNCLPDQWQRSSLSNVHGYACSNACKLSMPACMLAAEQTSSAVANSSYNHIALAVNAAHQRTLHCSHAVCLLLPLVVHFAAHKICRSCRPVRHDQCRYHQQTP
jgi:hypothetical protein